MTILDQRESRPGGTGLPPLDPRHADDTRPELTTAEVYAIIRGRLAAHVITKDTGGRVTCRSYRSLPAADKAVARALEAGKAATVILCRLDVAPLVGEGQR